MTTLARIDECFAATYSDARDRFLTAIAQAGAAPRCYSNPNRGPDGGELATDVAWFGPEDARRVFVMISSTHGAEGFCGSACQLDWLLEAGPERLPSGVAVLLVHTINPHGFAWVRRVTEEGCDLNRNYVDFSQPLPDNPGHDALVKCFVPASLDDDTLARTEAQIQAYRDTHGELAFQTARKAGQYKHPHSVSYGGTEPTWARRTLESIIAGYELPQRDFVSAVDFHTGLGPFGYGEPIAGHPPSSLSLQRVREMYGDSVGVPALGTSSSIPLHGTLELLWERLFGNRFTLIALEFGTYTPDEGRRALRADHWLHRQGDVDWDSPETRRIKAAVRRQFYPDTLDWKEMVLWRSRQIQRQTIEGLATMPHS